jgi:UDP-N-acetylglucosamine--N-acetylmuramyl-(pentapeptide) pyrophosphoryl-undecaprenol N-acetylglucosamine transferase
LAVVEALKSLEPDAEILYVGQSGGMEERIALSAGLEFAAIKAGKFRRLHGAGRLNKLLNPATLGLTVRDAARVAAGVAGSTRILKAFKPDVIFIKGGFVGLPVGIAAHWLKIPYVIHESDVAPGLANKILSRWANKIAVGFPVKSYHDFDSARLVYVGNPVRSELLHAHRFDGLAKFKLNEKQPMILVTGGSQGAAAINNAVLDALPLLLPKYQIIHLTGEGEFERVKFLVSRLKLPQIKNYHPFGFLMGTMAEALAAADVVVARAGANTIAELAALGKPTILIPNYLMAGHQVENARQMARAGAARVIDEPHLTPELLATEIDHVLSSEDEQRQLVQAMKVFAKEDAAGELAKLILTLAEG